MLRHEYKWTKAIIASYILSPTELTFEKYQTTKLEPSGGKWRVYKASWIYSSRQSLAKQNWSSFVETQCNNWTLNFILKLIVPKKNRN